MKKNYLFLFFVMFFCLFIFLTSCGSKATMMNMDDVTKLKQYIKKMDVNVDSDFYFKNASDEKCIATGKIVEDGFTLELHTGASDPYNYNFFRYKEEKVYCYKSYNETQEELYDTLENVKFETLDAFARHIINKNYGDVTIASYSDFVPFVKDAFDKTSLVKVGKPRSESKYEEANYYSVEVREEILINSSSYNTIKEFIESSNFQESKDDTIEVSIIASLKERKIDNRVSITANNRTLISLN